MAQQFACPQYLVTADWLHARLHDSAVRVIDGRPPGPYAAGHIPGTAHVDFMDLSTRDTSPEGLRAWIARMEAAFSAAGTSRPPHPISWTCWLRLMRL